MCAFTFFSGFLPCLGDAQSLDSLRRDFENPPRDVRPMVRWWWPGGDVTTDELRREVRVLDEAGFGGAEIQAFRIGLKTDVPADVAARVDDYTTPPFHRKVRVVAEEARDRGLFLDLTLGSGWPFGGGEIITPELASSELRFTRKVISGPSHFRDRIELPPPATAEMNLAHMSGLISEELTAGWQGRLRARTRVVAIVAVSGTEPVVEIKKAEGFSPSPGPIIKTPGHLDPQSARVLTDRMQPDGTF